MITIAPVSNLNSDFFENALKAKNRVIQMCYGENVYGYETMFGYKHEPSEQTHGVGFVYELTS